MVKWQQGIYQPDFYVRTTDDQNYVVEIKMNKELTSAIVQGKKAAAVEWVQIVDDAGFGRWRYLLLSEVGGGKLQDVRAAASPSTVDHASWFTTSTSPQPLHKYGGL